VPEGRCALRCDNSATAMPALAATSIARQLDYRSEIVLWESSVALAPWNARGHNNLGYAYQLAGRIPEARREYETALFFDPGNAKARLNLRFLEPARRAP